MTVHLIDSHKINRPKFQKIRKTTRLKQRVNEDKMVMHSNQRWTSQNLRLKLDTVFHVSVSDRPRIFFIYRCNSGKAHY